MWAILGKFFGAIGVFFLDYIWGKLSAYISEQKRKVEERRARKEKIDKEVETLKKADTKEKVDEASDDLLDNF